jgi:hypothetical protein
MSIKESDANGIVTNKKIDFKFILEDFFDFVIWESITSVTIGEIKGETHKTEINNFRKNLKELLVNSVIKVQEQSAFHTKVKDLCKKTPFINEISANYLIDTLSIFRKRLFEIYPEEELASLNINQEKLVNLNNMIEEYVLISYLDKTVLSNAMRILLYASKISFAEINEFRIQLIDLFKDGIEGKISLKEIDDFLRDQLDLMSVKPLIRDFVCHRYLDTFPSLSELLSIKLLIL